jgi:hypothetical protein
MKSMRVALLASVLAVFTAGTTVAYAADAPAAASDTQKPKAKKTKVHKAASKKKKSSTKKAAPATNG